MKIWNKFGIIFFVIVISIILHSCDSTNQQVEEDKLNYTNSLNLKVINDSTILTDDLNFKIDAFKEHLIHQKSLKFQEVHIHADPNISMTIIREIESICADYSIPRLVYHHQGDSAIAYFVPPPDYSDVSQSIDFKIDSTGSLYLEENKISESDNLFTVLRETIDTIANPVILLTTEIGTGYDYYVNHKKRINSALAKIDPNMELEHRITKGSYEFKK
ncbi:MAG: hypothetical protein KAT68_14005 [Bacteroidales bacterium]|nr:hypothetical protein [Bacteroidales bacterium]